MFESTLAQLQAEGVNDASFAALFRHAPVGVSIEDMSGRFLRVNPELEALLGYSAEELAQLSRLEITPPEGLVAYLPQITELMSGQRQRVDVTLPQRCKDGQLVWTRLTATPIRSSPDASALILCMAMDVTELVAARNSLVRLRTAIEVATDGMIIVRNDGSIRFANPAYAEMRGREDPAKLLDSRWLNAFPAKEAGRIAAELALGKGCWRGEVRAERQPNEFILEDVSVTPLPEGGAVIIIRDLSARERAEQERERLREQITQAQKIEAVARMAGGVAHDFNNLMAAILNYSEIVLEELATDHPARLYVERMRQAGKKGEALVRQILSLRQGAPTEQVPVELAELIQEVVAGVQPALQGTTRLTVVQPLPHETVVRGSPVQIEQVLINLCINAMHACEAVADAEVRVELTVGPPPDSAAAAKPTAQGRVKLMVGSPVSDGPHVRLVVADTGIGMSAEVAERMFDAFFTTKPMGRGTGIGLAAVQTIIQSHGGVIEVDTALGQGTRMTVYLPLYRPPDTPDITDAAPGRERILLVDDDDDARAATRRMVERLGYGVQEAWPRPSPCCRPIQKRLT